MAKNLIFGLILVRFCQIWSQKLFSQILFLLNVMHCYKLSFYVILRKTTEPHLRKWKKTQCRARFWSLWLKFGRKKLFSQILSLLDVRHCCKLSQHTISRKTNEPNLRKWQKILVLGPLLTHLAKIWTTSFFSKIQLRHYLDIMVSYHHVLYQKKLMIQSCENLVTEGQTDRRT